MPRRILVTGASGMLGTDMVTALSAGNEVTGWSNSQHRPDHWRIDATSRRQVDQFFAENSLDICVHCIANADVQACESDPESAARLNAETTRNVAEACVRHGVKLVYISTEYVFDGTAPHGYTESDIPRPLQVYGRTKRQGEIYASGVPGQLTVRLPVLYGSRVPGRGPTWTESLLHALERGTPVELDDQFERQPTWTRDIAGLLERAISRDLDGILHLASQEGMTKYAWGKRIAAAAGLSVSLLRPLRTPPPASGVAKPVRPWLSAARLELLGMRPPAGVSERVAPFLRSIEAGRTGGARR
ncbi:SDR family oxidoreductase [Streptomyces sp. NPDC006923]|uniref:SDR family oxidoreductase n=1 Tax=Streptomyces sp. NPDC006923 TaxID=3155355 RepID=UPI0033F840F3